ncbi:glycosyltransferase family A protein [Glaciecola sp. 1036]|uniref:glycosyltransferase family A protein n=1 Tax=Alteromonadaceae TaxID=72275 RepID=UPI003D00D105
MSYNIAVFAYNEEKHIQQSLKTIYDNVDKDLNAVYLLANGCTDKTVELAEKFKQTHELDSLNIITIKIGDKCNAWNHYVHKISPDANADCHFFVDSDVVFTEQCFPKLHALLLNATPTPNIVAGYPLSGRNLPFYQMLVEERSCFFGNLYGASEQYLEMVRSKKFSLPVGLNWIDSFLTKAANTDIQFHPYNLPNRVIYQKGVGFEFESLSPFKIDDIKLYKNRIARYELGKIQETFLDALAVEDWPENMREINMKIDADFDNLTSHLGIIKTYLVKKRLQKLLTK